LGPAERLTSKAAITACLEPVFEECDPALIAATLGDVARARGMTEVARAAGLGAGHAYKTLSKEGGPRLINLLGATKALGPEIHFAA
jgi:probable addiction module antidote protein